ncbi:MAG TPA: hypothetical protein VGM33_03310 [Baekduia sp.]|jgi:hypothetical protein
MSEAVLKEAMNRIAGRVDAVLGTENVPGNPSGIADIKVIVSDLDMDAALVKDQMHDLAGVVVGLWVEDPARPLCCLITDVLPQAFATGIMHERVRVEHERRAGT